MVGSPLAIDIQEVVCLQVKQKPALLHAEATST